MVTDSAHRYRTGPARSDEGLLVARFDDIHVWSWRNATDKLVTVTILLNGDYEDLHEVK